MLVLSDVSDAGIRDWQTRTAGNDYRAPERGGGRQVDAAVRGFPNRVC
jgi:hypothetical protein